jgi:hypothetical protein
MGPPSLLRAGPQAWGEDFETWASEVTALSALGAPPTHGIVARSRPIGKDSARHGDLRTAESVSAVSSASLAGGGRTPLVPPTAIAS